MRIAFLTSGGIAPCLSSSISMLIQEYKKQDLAFVRAAKKAIKNGKEITYNCSW